MEEKKPATAGSRLTAALDWTWSLAKDQWFLIVLLILVLISSQVQVPAAQQATKGKLVQYIAVAVIFFINGCTISTRTLVQNLRRWDCHLFVQALCFLLTSATAFAVVAATATNEAFMDPALLNGFVLLGCLPTALSFNTIMTKKSNANAALTLTQSVIGSILAPVISTALMQLYSSRDVWYTEILPKTAGGYGAVFKDVFKQLGLTLFLPLAVGQLTLNIFPKPAKKVMQDWHGSKLASFSLLTLIWSQFDGAFETGSYTSVQPDNIVFVVFILFALYFLWLAVAMGLSLLWLPRGDTVAVGFCVSTKTPALGVPLINIIFAGISPINKAKLTIPMILFQCIQSCLSSLATIPFRKWLAREKEKTEIATRENSS
ncbi:putative sodium bile acid cotransporter [Xylariaceae sp. FL0804]|nr:putative sodium bile acid cotransporter [Xylariaceae sp. FL0804]